MARSGWRCQQRLQSPLLNRRVSRPAHTHQPNGHPTPTADPTNPSVDSGFKGAHEPDGHGGARDLVAWAEEVVPAEGALENAPLSQSRDGGLAHALAYIAEQPVLGQRRRWRRETRRSQHRNRSQPPRWPGSAARSAFERPPHQPPPGAKPERAFSDHKNGPTPATIQTGYSRCGASNFRLADDTLREVDPSSDSTIRLPAASDSPKQKGCSRPTRSATRSRAATLRVSPAPADPG